MAHFRPKAHNLDPNPDRGRIGQSSSKQRSSANLIPSSILCVMARKLRGIVAWQGSLMLLKAEVLDGTGSQKQDIRGEPWVQRLKKLTKKA